MFGDILSDLAASVGGGIGLAPSSSLGAGRPGLYEAIHGSAPDIAGTGKANPAGAVLSASLMLDHLGEQHAAAELESAVDAVLSTGGAATAQAWADALAEQLAHTEVPS
jgi:isocitrate/isopropylmalate dehydrogenase